MEPDRDPDLEQEERCEKCAQSSYPNLPPCARIEGDSVCDGHGNAIPA